MLAVVHGRAAAEPPKRPVPAYDGRPAPNLTFADVARGTARVVLWPIYAVVNYGLRAPAGWVIRSFEESRTAKRVIQYAFLGPPSETLSVYPVAFYDFGFQSSVGVRMAWLRSFATPGSTFNLKLGFGGIDWRRAEAKVKIALPADTRLTGEFILRRRPDLIFHGIGSRTSDAALARYTLNHAEVIGGAGWRGLSAYAGIASIAATESSFGGDPSIDDQVALGRYERPSGYRDLLVIERAGAKLALDTRGKNRKQSGARLDATVERLHEHELGSWTLLEGQLGGALRMDTVGEYKLDVRLRVELVEPDRGSEVPFLSLASVGGTRDLRGFASGRARDRSAVAMMVDYQWPLAAWLDATVYAGAGNVFGERLSGFYMGKLRGSFGAGLAIAGLSSDRQIELWTAAGTDPFDQGWNISSFRLVLGFSHDY